MKDIVLQTAIGYIKDMMNYLMDKGISDIGAAAADMREISNDYTGRMLVAMIERMDECLREDKKLRKRGGYVIHQKNASRTVFTELGYLTYHRTYFKDKESGKMIYLTDHLVGVETYDRVCSDIAAKLVSKSAEYSYGKSVDTITGGALSRQTARNKMMRTKELAYVPEKSAHTPPVLHIFADEDHVHMQNSRSNIVPLVTVSEGKRAVCKGRNALIDPLHIQGYKTSSDDLWDYTYALCCRKYDIEKVEKIYVHGDGAPWILKGSSIMDNSYHVLDHYHIKSKMRSLTAGAPDGYSSRLWGCLKRSDRTGFHDAVHDLISDAAHTYPGGIRKRHMKKIRKAGAYILANWEAVMRRLDPDITGSCTEPMISHILSERLSRNPMGWSEAGLSKMARARVYVKNGGRITRGDIAQGGASQRNAAPRKIERYEALVAQDRKSFLSMPRDWSLFEKENSCLGQITGTKVALDALGRMRNIG
jgi:hypothetical protein